MAQGKLKVKNKLPTNIKKSSVLRGQQKKPSKVVMKKKTKQLDAKQKLQMLVTKEINKNIEAEARGMAKKFSLGESSKK
ncbi:hypothetical protein QR98_0035620 [Sarcoptes scabiei]|uniref:Uncharacterized protein n=1 Tax=Sarcoptes scabiei TaxID=52283 RepID=A0A132A2F1_SARSC|nr:hypothetical protein QR98_0035620 [Sarcoptes scabiei]